MSVSSRKESSFLAFLSRHQTLHYRGRTVINSIDSTRYTDFITFVLVSLLIPWGQPWWSLVGIFGFLVIAAVKVWHTPYKIEQKFLSETASTPEQAGELIKNGYEYVTTVGNELLFKKRKREK